MYRNLNRSLGSLKRRTEVLVWNQNKCNSSTNVPIQAGFGKVLIILTPFAVGGSVVAYAKYDDDFRKTLVKSVPAIEPVLKVVLGEEKPFAEVRNKFENATSTVTSYFGSSTATKVDEFKTKIVKKPEEIIKNDSIPKKTQSKTTIDNSVPVPAPPSSSITPKKEESVTVATLSSPTAVDIEKTVESATTFAIQEYNKAINILKLYNEEVKKIVDESIDKLDNTKWASLKNKTNSRNSAVQNAERIANEARENIHQIERSLSSKGFSYEIVETLKRKIKVMTDHLDSAKAEFFKAKEISDTNEKYWKKVETARNYFVEEMEALFPGIDLTEKKLNLSKDDLDLFIMHAYSHVLAYQRELEKLQINGDAKLKRAMDTWGGDDQTEALRAQLEYHISKEKRELELDNQKKIFKIKAETEKEFRLQMKRQSEAHSDHLKDAIDMKEKELKRLFARELDEKLSNEQASYKLQITAMLGKLKGMNTALKARANVDKSAQQAQALWSACISLWSSIKSGDVSLPSEKRVRPLSNEIKAICSAAAEGDKLVEVVLKSLPDVVQTRGVFPEDILKERFLNVEKLARRLALVPENGARLPMYILSYIQSIFMMKPDNPISKEEILDQEIDFKKLDTYEILNRARYWIDHGNLSQSIKYMNLLDGAPRKIACEWLNEARLFLEIQQAVDTLLAHAAASGYQSQ